MVQAGGAGRGRAATAALPGVEAEVVVIVAGRKERRGIVVARHQREPQDAAIELERAGQVTHLEVGVPEPRIGGDVIDEFGCCRGRHEDSRAGPHDVAPGPAPGKRGLWRRHQPSAISD